MATVMTTTTTSSSSSFACHEPRCLRCSKTVYPTDKIGPLKDYTFFHSGCFRCVVCGSKLTLKTYYNNQHSMEDKEVYCHTHVPKIKAGQVDNETMGIKSALNAPRSNMFVNEQIRPGGKAHFDADALAIRAARNSVNTSVNTSVNNGNNSNGNNSNNGSMNENTDHWGRFDSSALHIQHALRATEVQRRYSKPREEPMEAYLDREEQIELEKQHREEEDRLFKKFKEKRDEEHQRIVSHIAEEWEVELEKLTAKFEKEISSRNHEDIKRLTLKHSKDRKEMEKTMTLKRDKKKESVSKKLLEQERAATAAMVEKHSSEMMRLIQEKRAASLYNGEDNDDDIDDDHHHTEVTTSPKQDGRHDVSLKKQRDGNNMSNNGVVVSSLRSGDQVSSSLSVRNGSKEMKTSSVPSVLYPSQPPPPSPPSFSKHEIYRDPIIFESVDQRAINIAQDEQTTFTDLVRQLVSGCVSDVEKARAIFRWITVKNLNSILFKEHVQGDTPMGLLRGIKFGTESYHVLFKRLCSYAGLHCVVIKGYSKSAGYQPGVAFEDNRFRNSWNAVYVAGAWRFVQCNWGARHLVNAKDAGPKPGRAKADSLRYEYDDHYFLTDPKSFVYEFFPLQSEWQLLRHPLSQAEFEELPFVRSLFFRYELAFPSDNMRSVMHTDASGAASIRIQMPDHRRDRLIFHYNLKFYDDDHDNFDNVSLKRFVMQSVSGSTVTFRVHAPCSGSLLLDVFANAVTPAEYLTGEPMKFKSVCKFKIACEHLQTVMVPLPDCASGEWGPAKAARLFGLMSLSHSEPLVFASHSVDLVFRMSRPLTDFMATLHKNGMEEKRLAKYVGHHVDDNIVTFTIAFPEEGQYGLDIYTREVKNENNGNVNEKQLLTHCCKYLINSSRKHAHL